MRIHRGLLGWGVFFIVVGAVPLAVQAGLVDEDVVRRAWQLWPLILIGIGLGLVLQRTSAAVIGGLVVAITFGLMVGGALAVGFAPMVGFSSCGFGNAGGEGDAFPTQSGTFDPDARVSLELSCGELAVTPAAGSDWSLSGTSEGGEPPEVSGSGSRLSVRSPERSGFDIVHGSRWRMALPTGTSIRLGLTINAGSVDAGLAAMQVPDLDVSVNAGDATVDMGETLGTGSVNGSVNAGSLSLTLPAPEGTLSGSLSANAGSIEVCVPDGVGLRIHSSDSALGSNNFGDRGLAQSGETWTRPGWETSAQRIDLDVSANLGSITLNPEAGCD